MTKARDIASAVPAPSTVSSAELGHLDGVTSAIQTQIDTKIGSASAINPTIVDAKGDIIAATAADTVARLAVGTNGQVLTADSTAATGLAFATPAASGGMTLINSGGTTLTGASVLISSIPATYKNLQLVVRAYLPSSNTAKLQFRFNDDSNANRHQSDEYNDNARGFDQTSATMSSVANSTTNTGLLVVDLYDYTNTASWKFGMAKGLVCRDINAAQEQHFNCMIMYNQLTAVSSIRLLPSTGNFTSGTAYLYGVQ